MKDFPAKTPDRDAGSPPPCSMMVSDGCLIYGGAGVMPVIRSSVPYGVLTKQDRIWLGFELKMW